MSGAKVPESSSAQFDALIELLATEDTGENSNFHIAPEGTASTGLRDGDGKLDYAKIRSLFLQRQGSDDVNRVPFSDPASHHEPSSGIKLPQVSYESYVEEVSLLPSQIVVEEPTAVIEVPVIPTVQPPQRVVESGILEMIPTVCSFASMRYDRGALQKISDFEGRRRPSPVCLLSRGWSPLRNSFFSSHNG
jgi:hypothetical protein